MSKNKIAINDREVFIELCAGAEGPCIILNGRRIAGPKPWGGGRIVNRFRTTIGDIKEAITPRQLMIAKGEQLSELGKKRISEAQKSTNEFYKQLLKTPIFQ